MRFRSVVFGLGFLRWCSWFPFFFQKSKRTPAFCLIASSLLALFVPTAFAQLSTNNAVFQFAAFFNLDLDFSPGQVMVVNGKVHCNGTIWMYPQAAVTFNDTVEATVVVTNKDNPNDQQNLTSRVVPTYNGGAPLSGVSRLGIPINSPSTNPASFKAILDLPPTAVAAPNPVAYDPINQIYLYNACDLIISNSATGIRGAQGTNITIYYQDKDQSGGPLIQLTNNEVCTVSNISAHTSYITNSPVLPSTNCIFIASGFPFVTNVAFYDFREAKTVQAVQIDVSKLKVWLTNSACEGLRWNQQCSTNKGHLINSIYVFSSVPLTGAQLPAVRLINGQHLPSPYGLTIATPMPLYVLGHYNTQTNSAAPPNQMSINTSNTAWTWPAALMGDAITILSGNWNDSNSLARSSYNPPEAGSGSGNRVVGSNITVNAACFAGIVPSTYTTHKQYSGGLESFLRLQEDWRTSANTLWYNGSIVAMFPSSYATNYWIGPADRTGYPIHNYTIPTRKWGFDINFLNPAKLPPLTPQLSSNPPVFIIHPRSKAVPSGSTVTFSAIATGSPVLVYQWIFNGTNLVEATNTSLTLTNVQFDQAGNYRVRATNALGSALSSNAVLTVTATPPAIQAQPTNQTVFVNGPAAFSVTASGSLPLSYQWRFGEADLEGATHASLTLTNVQLSQAGNYSVQVTNAFGSTNSINVALNAIDLPPAILIQPTNQTAFVHDTITFSATATGFPPLRYQWRFNEADLDGATNASLTLTNVQLSQAGNYAVLVTNAYGSILSSNAALTVNPPAPCVEPPAGLVAWWQGEENANDSTGTNHGTLINGAGFAAGKVGQAFSLNGTGYVLIPDSPVLDSFVSSITIETWIKVNQLPSGSWTAIVTKGDSSWRLHRYASTSTVGFSTSGLSNGDLAGSKNINDGQWHHVAGVYDGTNKYLYVDGVMDASAPATGSISQNSSPVCIGENASMTGRRWNGWIDEVSIYNRALSAAEIQAIYDARSNGKCALPPTLLTQPTNQTVFVNDTATFRVVASGSAPLSYQWSCNEINLNGATNASLMLTNVQMSQAGDYAVLVTNTGGSVLSSNAVLTVIALPPTIQTQPTNQTVFVNGTVTFAVGAGGTTPLGYQWNFNGVDIDGATNAALTLANVQTNQTGTYAVQVTNAYGSILSSNAVLTVIALPPTISSQPTNRTVIAGGSTIFSVTATGSMPLSYQWSFNGTNISGATNTFLALTNVQADQAGNYVIQVSNLFGSTNSTTAVLVVELKPIIFIQPTNQILKAGSTSIFRVSAGGLGPLSYQWQFNGTDIDGATNPLLTLDNVQTNNQGPYQIIVTNAYGSVTSSIATLTLTRSFVVVWGDQTNVPDGLGNVTAIAAGSDHNMALEANGTVAAWGGDTFGQTDVPADLTNVVAISAGVSDSLALQSNGKVIGWGFDSGGQINIPRNLTNVVAIAAGGFHSLALRADGTVAAWGEDYYGQTDVPGGLTNVVAIAAGGFHGLALQANGTVVAWGHYGYGIANVPAGLTNVVAIAGGHFHSLALRANGTVAAWGLDESGQTDVPLGLTNVVAIAGGHFHSLALRANGTIVGWGYNVNGDTQAPAGLTNVIAIAAGGSHSMALENDGSPVILRQPASQTALNNSKVLFNVAAVGRPQLSYQWQKDGADLTDGGNVSGATSVALTLANVQPGDAGAYTLFMTNDFGSITSSNAVLTVLVPPSITTQPAGCTNVAGTTASFNVAADGTAPLNYQWQSNGTNLVGATNATLTLNNVTLDQAGTYSVTVVNLAGSMPSSNAVLSVYATAAATLDAFTFSNGGAFQLQVAGVPGFNYAVQSSTNLIDWASLLTNTSPFIFVDANATNFPQQFYRALYLP